MAEEEIKEIKKAEKKHPLWILVLAIVLVVAFFAIKDNWNGIQDSLNPKPVEPTMTQADVTLYKFDALTGNKSTNIEIWLLNTGETTAKNITLRVRSRTQNGTVVLDKNISLSALVLRGNEMCTGDFTIMLSHQHLYHTIEVSWDNGRHTYSKETL